MPDNNWPEAFSALPTEAPEPLGWERLQVRLPAPTPRRSWPRWLAAAAVLAITGAIPLALMKPAVPQATKPAAAKTVAPAADITQSMTRVAPSSPADAVQKSTAPGNRHIASAPKAGHASPIRQKPTTGDELEPLYRQSAQLETLLSMARDEQVAGGVSTALSDDLGTRISRIDDRLSRADLQPQQRAVLWHQRIDTLQQLVGIAATDRLYSARGQRHDAVLVSID